MCLSDRLFQVGVSAKLLKTFAYFMFGDLHLPKPKLKKTNYTDLCVSVCVCVSESGRAC